MTSHEDPETVPHHAEQIARLEAQIEVAPQAPAAGGTIPQIPGLAAAEHQRRMSEQGW